MLLCCSLSLSNKKRKILIWTKFVFLKPLIIVIIRKKKISLSYSPCFSVQINVIFCSKSWLKHLFFKIFQWKFKHKIFSALQKTQVDSKHIIKILKVIISKKFANRSQRGWKMVAKNAFFRLLKFMLELKM